MLNAFSIACISQVTWKQFHFYCYSKQMILWLGSHSIVKLIKWWMKNYCACHSLMGGENNKTNTNNSGSGISVRKKNDNCEMLEHLWVEYSLLFLNVNLHWNIPCIGKCIPLHVSRHVYMNVEMIIINHCWHRCCIQLKDFLHFNDSFHCVCASNKNMLRFLVFN